MIVLKSDKNGVLRISRPCSHCIRLLKRCGVGRVIYSDEDGSFVEESVSGMDEKTAHVTTGWRLLETKRVGCK